MKAKVAKMCDAEVQSFLKLVKEPSVSLENACSMELRHSFSSDRSSLLEEILPATHFWAILSLGPHVQWLLWIVWLERLHLQPPWADSGLSLPCQKY